MTVKQIKMALENQPDDRHVLVTIIPDRQVVVPVEGTRFELHNIALDQHFCLNLVAVTPADQPQPGIGK